MTTAPGLPEPKSLELRDSTPRKVDHGRSGGILHTISEDVKGDLSLATICFFREYRNYFSRDFARRVSTVQLISCHDAGGTRS
jgi:hypothetical protein